MLDSRQRAIELMLPVYHTIDNNKYYLSILLLSMASHKSTLHTLSFRLVAIGSETIPTDRVMHENTDYTGGVVCTMSVVT